MHGKRRRSSSELIRHPKHATEGADGSYATGRTQSYQACNGKWTDSSPTTGFRGGAPRAATVDQLEQANERILEQERIYRTLLA